MSAQTLILSRENQPMQMIILNMFIARYTKSKLKKPNEKSREKVRNYIEES